MTWIICITLAVLGIGMLGLLALVLASDPAGCDACTGNCNQGRDCPKTSK